MDHKKRVFILGGTEDPGLSIGCAVNENEYQVTLAGRSQPAMRLDSHKWCDIDVSYERFRLPPLPRFDFIFAVLGEYIKEPFIELTPSMIQTKTRANFTGPLLALTELLSRQHARPQLPCHVIIVISTSSWKTRPEETLFGGLHAGVAQVARNLGHELPKTLPGSRLLLIHTEAVQSRLWKSHDVDTQSFLHPELVAQRIWTHILEGQSYPFEEIQILRGNNGMPALQIGAMIPK
jgi:short-subunit dehydrogenase